MIKEYIGYKDPIGNGQYNMGLTDEEVIRCRDCIYWIDEDFCNNPKWHLDSKLLRPCTEPDGYCAWSESGDA